MDDIDRYLLKKVQDMFPKTSIQVLGGFSDGWGVDEDGPVFGSVPHDGDGTVLVVDFRGDWIYPYKEWQKRGYK